MLKNTFVWLMCAVAACAVAYKVATRPAELRGLPPAPPAIVVVAPPQTYTEFREAHEVPPLAPVTVEAPRVAVPHKTTAAKVIKAKTRPVIRLDDGKLVPVPCVRLRAGVAKYPEAVVTAGALAHGFSLNELAKAKHACGI